ncbi:MAG TPA: type II secretion system F family protein [Mycobacteriales bacterium]|nr:type II secretion system F family protein [Mycobacteriales bacterium]
MLSVPEGNVAQKTGEPAAHRSLRRLLAAAVVLAAGIAVGGLFGILLGVAGAAVVALLRLSAAPPTVDPDDVPVVVDLVAGCLAAGASLPAAFEAAAVAASEVMRLQCRVVAAALHAGAPPDEVWRDWLANPWLAPVARTALRTAHTGAAAAEDLRRTSARLRARRRAAAQHRVRQASVWLVVPLGLFFLPAFVLVAVVPLVIGLLPTLR